MKYMYIILLASLLISCGGEKEDSILTLTILAQPSGGLNVTSVNCLYDAHLTQGSDPIEIAVEWWWEDAFGMNDQCVTRTFYDIDNTSSETYTTSYAALPGYILTNYYWVEFKWQNADGSFGWIVSQKAFCSY